MCIVATKWEWKKGACNILPKQEIYRLWIQILAFRENLLCFCLGCLLSQTIHGVSYYSTDIQNGPYKVYVWETCRNQKNSPMEDATNRVRHSICHTKSYKREYASGLSLASSNIRLSTYTIWISRRRYYGNKGLWDPMSRWGTRIGIMMEADIRWFFKSNRTSNWTCHNFPQQGPIFPWWLGYALLVLITWQNMRRVS